MHLWRLRPPAHLSSSCSCGGLAPGPWHGSWWRERYSSACWDSGRTTAAWHKLRSHRCCSLSRRCSSSVGGASTSSQPRHTHSGQPSSTWRQEDVSEDGQDGPALIKARRRSGLISCRLRLITQQQITSAHSSQVSFSSFCFMFFFSFLF